MNEYLAFVFPSCYNNWEFVETILKNNFHIIDKNTVSLTEEGKFNLLQNIYKNDSWLGNAKDNYSGLFYKLEKCFPSEISKVNIYLFKSKKDVPIIKENIRKFLNIGKHSIHMTDFNENINELINLYFNKNSIEYLNKVKIVNQKNFLHLFNRLKLFIKNNKLNLDEFLITGSAVLSVYNLRDCWDLDFFYIGSSNIKNIDEKITCYNSYYNNELHNVLSVSIKSLVSNNNHHFYYSCMKFMNLNLIKTIKSNRLEQKDIADIELIKKVV